MKNTYTFLLYLSFGLFAISSNCFELDIGQISKYRKGVNEINVYRDDSGNFYKHKPYEPFLLKELYYDDDVIYFDPLLTSDQLLISASVLWVLDNPTVIHLNLEKSSVILLNENNLTLTVESIFSRDTISNINHKSHPDSDKLVDVDIKQTQDYVSNSFNVSVKQLHLSGNGLERFVLRYYDIGSYRLDNLKYGTENSLGFGNLTTNVIEDAVPGNYEDKKNNFPLNVPNKELIYGVYLYSYNNFPLVMELVYTYNERVYMAFTSEKRYHRVLMPTINEPYYREKLLNRLNYYACMNGFKYTVDIMKTSDEADGFYTIDNYCIGPNGVDKVKNKVKLKYESRNDNNKYKCYEHSGENNEEFFVDNLYCGESLFEIQNLPKNLDSMRVYRYRNNRPCLITIVDNNSLLYYKRESDKWKYFNTDDNLPNINTKFNEKINRLLDELDPDEELREEKLKNNQWKKEPKSTFIEILNLLPDKVNIKVEGDKTYQMRTFKYDKRELESKRLKRFQFDIYSYMDPVEQISAISDGHLNTVLHVETRPNCALIAIYYDGRPIIEFEKNDVLVHKAVYFYRKPTDNMDVYLYTNSLYVYHFRNNYYKYDYRWELVSKKPVTLADSDDIDQNIKRYFEEIEKLNPKTTNPEKSKEIIVNDDAINLMPDDQVTILTRNYLKETIVTIKKDKSNNNQSREEFNVSNFDSSSSTKQSCSHSVVKYNDQTLVNLNKSKYHLIKLIEFIKEDDELTLYLYTNTLYVFRYRKKPPSDEWKFINVQPVMCPYKNVSDPLEPYFTKMNEINKFDFKVNIFENILDLLPSINVNITTKLNERYNITTIKKNLALIKNDEIVKKEFDLLYYLNADYTEDGISEYLKFMNMKRSGKDEAKVSTLPLYAINHIKWGHADVFKVYFKDRCVFLAVEYIHKDNHTHIYGYTNALYVFHAYRHDNDGYNYHDWKRKKEPAVIDDSTNDDPKICRDLKKYFKLAKNINNFDFD